MLDNINLKAKSAVALGAAVIAASAFAVPGLSLADEDNTNNQVAENAEAVATELDNSNASNENGNDNAESADDKSSDNENKDSENKEAENAEGDEQADEDAGNSDSENADGEEADGENANEEDNENKELTEEEKAEKKKKFDELIDFKLTDDQKKAVNEAHHSYQVRSEYSGVFRVIAGDELKAAIAAPDAVSTVYNTANRVADEDYDYTYGFITVDKDGKAIYGGSKAIKGQDKVEITDEQVKKAVEGYLSNYNWKKLELVTDKDMDAASGDDTTVKVDTAQSQEITVNGWKVLKWTGTLERKEKVFPMAVYAVVDGDTATWVTVSAKNYQTGTPSTAKVEETALDVARSYRTGKDYVESGAYLIPSDPNASQMFQTSNGVVSAEDLGLDPGVQVVTE